MFKTFKGTNPGFKSVGCPLLVFVVILGSKPYKLRVDIVQEMLGMIGQVGAKWVIRSFCVLYQVLLCYLHHSFQEWTFTIFGHDM